MERERSSLLTVGRSMMEPSDRYVSTSPNLPHQHELVSNSYTDVGDGGREGGKFPHYELRLPLIAADVKDSERC